MKVMFKYFITGTILALVPLFAGCATASKAGLSEREAVFSHIVAADMRQYAGPKYQTSQYFLGTCEAILKIGKGAFMVSPGDIDPPQHASDTVRKVLGEDYPWYPVVGNHEAETEDDMIWLRNWARQGIPNLVRKGPENSEETTYSFDFRNAHFVVINEYYDGKSDSKNNGDVIEPLYRWLKDDLEANTKPFVFVFGHEPLVSIPDYHNGRHRHKGDNLDAHPKTSHRFQQLLRKHKVVAYICGHTHNFSYSRINGLLQLDAGHCRGIGDKGARSTFLKVFVGKKTCWVEVYRDDANGGPYVLTQTITLD